MTALRLKKLSRWILGTASVASLAAGCGDDDGSMRMDAELPDGGPPAADSGPVTTDSGPVTTDSGPVTTDAGPVTTDAGPVTTDAGPVDEREALEAALRDACTLFVACEADVDYSVEDCLGYYTPYIDASLAVDGCATPLTEMFRCVASLTCESLGSDDVCGEREAAVEAACPDFDGPPDL